MNDLIDRQAAVIAVRDTLKRIPPSAIRAMTAIRELPPAPDPEEAAAVERLKANPKREYKRKLSKEEFLDAMARKRGEL